VVEVRGSSNAFDGLVIQSGRCTVRGLSFHDFATAIRLGGGTNVVQGSFIGVDHTGVFPFGNGVDGIYVDRRQPDRRNGPGAGNLISGNSGNGITLASLPPKTIGSRATSLAPESLNNALPNSRRGIFLTNGAA